MFIKISNAGITITDKLNNPGIIILPKALIATYKNSLNEFLPSNINQIKSKRKVSENKTVRIMCPGYVRRTTDIHQRP